VPHPPYRCSLASLTLYILATYSLAGLAEARPHPRLLITPERVPALRHAVGLKTATPAAPSWGPFGRHAGHYLALRAHFATAVPGEPLPGELAAAAFLQRVDPHDPGAADRLELISAALEQPNWVTTDPLELVLALDWCWDDLAPRTRRDFALQMRRRAEPLAPGDSPLEPDVFRERLAALALAITIDESDDPNPSWLTLRKRLVGDARTYFSKTFPAFLAWRGRSPTGPAAGPDEENLTALALELARHVLSDDPWAAHGPVVGRWLEHYVFARHTRPQLPCGFLRDDGAAAPQSPAPDWRALHALTAHLIASRTRDPSAAFVAREVAARMRAARSVLPSLARWVPVVCEIAEIPAADPTALPTARHLDGMVVFQAGDPAGVVVWIDAAPPFLRRRQHFDAGHFLVWREHALVVDQGDDVTFEAVPSKGGKQRLGSRDEPFDFEQYFTASIAHNCLVSWDAARFTRWYDQRYIPGGGQRPIEDTCSDFETTLAAQQRVTGKTLAYGQSDEGLAYLALDLAPAYNEKAIAAYTREFLFALDRVLVVVDRVELTSSRSPPTWVLNIPARPTVDGKPLSEAHQRLGGAPRAGMWDLPAGEWLRWTQDGDALWLGLALPSERQLRVVGGPGAVERVAEGPFAGRPYVGGAEGSFERLVIPSDRHDARNAWYELGHPAVLGEDFGRMGRWGRIEVEPAARGDTVVFAHVLVGDRAAAPAGAQPTLRMRTTDALLTLTVEVDRHTLRVDLPAGLARGGAVQVTGPQSQSWPLPTDVATEGPLAPANAADD
jgi:hypothetical protein